LSSVPAEKSGLNLSPDGVRRFTLQSRGQPSSEAASGQNAVSIFLVEDNPADAGLLRKSLEQHDFEGELVIATDGESAIQFIDLMDSQQVECPHLVIIDLNLPKRSGREVLVRMRRSARCGKVPIVILSSSDVQQDKADAARLGATQYLRKPSRLDEFLDLGRIFKDILGGSPR